VLSLLARGRNGSYIKDELVVSYNTVKAHVKHIYKKLGIHTHRELIDLIES
jgi:DNA-binding NarL/FixJ family response regulator